MNAYSYVYLLGVVVYGAFEEIHLSVVDFAQRVLSEGITPRNGSKSDQAHPPIHPTKYTDSLSVSDLLVQRSGSVMTHSIASLRGSGNHALAV